MASRPDLPPLSAPRLAIRRSDRLDEAALQSVLDGAPDYHERTFGRVAAPDAAARLLDEVEADPERRVWLLTAQRNGLAVGLVDVWLDQPEPFSAHLGLLVVREAFQGQGYGAEAVQALERALAHAGFRSLRLSVGDENPAAQAFWERLGFSPAGRLEDGVTVYEKALRRP
jgi:RimJ/RimL family protein N-acetyltransferase